MRVPLLLSLLSLAVAAGCEPSRENIVHSSTAGEQAPSTTATGAPTDTTAPAPTPGGAVEVTLIERRIEMPATLPAGPTVFRVTNRGDEEHNFEIEGDGIERELPRNLAAGESGSLEVDLRPGTYRVYCPVGNHAAEGMEMQLTVTEQGAQRSGV